MLWQAGGRTYNAMATEPFSIVLLHEQALLRQAVAHLFAEQPGARLQAQAADVPALKRALAVNTTPQLLLLSAEAALADQCGLLFWLAKQCPTTRLLVLGNRTPAEALYATLCAGAHGYYCTAQARDRMLTVAQQLLDGAIHFPDAVLAHLRTLRPAWEPDPVDDDRPIAPCQREFVRWLLMPEDLSYAEIAEGMGKSIYAVKKYATNLFKRFATNSKSGLVKIALRRQLDRLGPPVAANKAKGQPKPAKKGP